MKIHVFDPNIKSLNGHNYGLNLACQKIFNEKKIKSSFYLYKGMDENLTFPSPVLKFFNMYCYADFSYKGYPEIGRLEDEMPEQLKRYAYFNFIIEKDLNSIPQTMIKDDDIIFMHSATIYYLQAVAAWYSARQLKAKVFCIVTDHLFYDVKKDDFSIFKSFYDNVAWHMGDNQKNWFFMDPSQKKLDFLGQIFKGANTILCPVPTHKYPVKPKEKPMLKTVAFVGNTLQIKGLNFIGSVVKTVHEVCPDAQFLIHDPGAHIKEPLNDKNVVLKQYHIENEEYYNDILASDIICLAYDPNVYRIRSSNIFCEALMAKKIMIVPDHTWLSEEAAKLDCSYHCFQENTAESIADSIVHVLNDFEQFYDKAQNISEASVQYHNTENFMNLILENITHHSSSAA